MVTAAFVYSKGDVAQTEAHRDMFLEEWFDEILDAWKL